MKTKIILMLLFVWTVLAQGQEAKFEITENSKKMGFVAYLTQLKYKSEFQMSKLVNSNQYSVQIDKAEEFNKTYNLLKTNIDILINQMSVDLYKSNRLRLYKATDNYMKKNRKFPSKYSSYEDCLERIKSLSSSLEFKNYSSIAGVPIADWESLGTLVLDVVKMEQENRQKKVEKVVSILNQLRLKSITELKDEKDKKQ